MAPSKTAKKFFFEQEFCNDFLWSAVNLDVRFLLRDIDCCNCVVIKNRLLLFKTLPRSYFRVRLCNSIFCTSSKVYRHCVVLL